MSAEPGRPVVRLAELRCGVTPDEIATARALRRRLGTPRRARARLFEAAELRAASARINVVRGDAGETVTVVVRGPRSHLLERLQDMEGLLLVDDWGCSPHTVVARLCAPGAGAGEPALSAPQRRFLAECLDAGPTTPPLSALGPFELARWDVLAGGLTVTVRRWRVPAPGPSLFELSALVPREEAPFLRPSFAATISRWGLDPNAGVAPIADRAAAAFRGACP